MALILFTHTKTWNFLKRDSQDSWEKQDNIFVFTGIPGRSFVYLAKKSGRPGPAEWNDSERRGCACLALQLFSSCLNFTPTTLLPGLTTEACLLHQWIYTYMTLYIYIYTHNQHNKQYWILGRKSKRGVQRLCWILMVRKVRDRTGTGS